MHRRSKVSKVPPIKYGDKWILDPSGRANAYAKCFDSKFKLPPERVEMFFGPPVDTMIDLNIIRSRAVKKELRNLRTNQATGPDRLAAILLRALAAALALPVAILCRRMFHEHVWPTRWRTHFLFPLFKKGSVFDPNNYRGLHLTSILSKVAERVIGNPLIMFLQEKGFGTCQWAFRKRASARDLVTLSLAVWILATCQNLKVGIYLADIAAAFDRVSRCLLLGKLCQCGVSPSFSDFLNSYLQEREARVTVGGAMSEAFVLCDMVYQGTVLGPTLWNTFFGDIANEIVSGDQQCQIFADDLNAIVKRDVHISNDLVISELQEIQQRAHAWGNRNRVTFDPAKEHFHILHPLYGEGTQFKLLGILLDSEFNMTPLIDSILAKITPKIRAIERMRHVYSLHQLLDQFKMHIWSYLEYSNGAIIVAKVADRRRLDKAQRGFLYRLGCNDTQAFVDCNFAPPSLRRAIGILGFLHKRTLGKCHASILQALPPVDDHRYRYHSKSLQSFLESVRAWPALYNRSLWQYVIIYNRLPQGLIETGDVSTFQAKLTQLAKGRASNNDPRWRESFQSCEDVGFFHTVSG